MKKTPLYAAKFFVAFASVYFAAFLILPAQEIAPDELRSVVEFHNNVRKEVGSPPLEWSNDLATYAQEWANYLAQNGCALQHRPNIGRWKQQYGENIFWGAGKTYTLQDAAKSWYSEKKFWRGGKLTGRNWSKSGHYTQMVWSKSTKVGIAKATCKNGATIIVANYDPAGNMMGEKPY